MSIIVSSIIRNFHDDTKKGQKRVFEMHTDQSGEDHECIYSCPLDYDVDQALIDNALTLGDDLIEQEKTKVKTAVEAGVDHARITVKHITAVQKAKEIIRAMMSGSPRNVIKAAEYVEGLTNAQLRSHFSTATAIRIRDRQILVTEAKETFLADIREEI